VKLEADGFVSLIGSKTGGLYEKAIIVKTRN